MTSVTDSTKNSLITSSILGVVRGISVNALIYPLEVVKIHQQTHFNHEKSYQVALRLFQTGERGVFYKGIQPQLLKTSIKQAWCWPMITGIPHFLEKHKVTSLSQQAVTGFSIATVDALMTTPLEGAKILSISSKRTFSLENLYNTSWRGFTTHWTKLSVYWSTFLVSQKYFRDRCKENSPPKSLPLSQLGWIGIQVSLVVSFVSAPFDAANTLKIQNQPLSQLFSGNVIRKMYRGWPINTLSLLVHNIASVILIEKLNSHYKNV